jgi:hypothetical protein
MLVEETSTARVSPEVLGLAVTAVVPLVEPAAAVGVVVRARTGALMVLAPSVTAPVIVSNRPFTVAPVPTVIAPVSPRMVP